MRGARTTEDVDLAYAWFLHRQGDQEGARGIVGRLRHLRFEVQRQHSWGFSDVTYTMRLRWLQELLGIPEGAVPGAGDEREEAYVRVERAARELGKLRALASKGEVAGDRRTLFRSLLLFHNRPAYFGTLPLRHSFVVQTSRKEIYGKVGALAKAMGSREVSALRDVVVDLAAGPTASQFTPHHRRHFARLFHDEGVMSRGQAIELALSSTTDAEDDDPSQRQEACLDLAALLHRLGDRGGSTTWKARASEVAAGAGSHKDYHMAHLAEWLARSITQADTAGLEVLDRYVRAVEVSGGDGASDGAATALRLLVRLAPARAWRLAVEQIDRDVLSVWQVLEALIAGGADAGANPKLLAAMYGELYALIAPGDTSETAAAVLGAFPREQSRDAAERLMSYVRTNALPSHRAPVARALEEGIRRQGIGATELSAGLEPGRDDSSRKSTLYQRETGKLETLGQVAERLGDAKRTDTWNPSPQENAEFDWWAAISEADIKDEEHFNRLAAKFPPPDYREVEWLARRADVLLDSGNRDSARAVIEEAITRSKDGSWHRWVDGAHKVIVFRVLKRIDHAEGVVRARAQFSRDLGAGNLFFSYLLSDIGDILELLEVDWPAAAVLEAVQDYLEQVLAANTQVARYEALAGAAPAWTVDQGLCRFLAELLAFPVVDVGVAARRALAKYVAANGGALLRLLRDTPWWNPLQLEHILAAVHVGVSSGWPHIGDVRELVESLKGAESLAVRSVAKRICEAQGWVWEDVTTVSAQPVILLARASSSPQELGMVVGGDTTIDWELHQALISPLRRAGLDVSELRSEFDRVYWTLEKEYPWANDGRLKRWIAGLLVRFWLSPGAIIGREAAMRVFGRCALSSRVRPGAENAYDRFYPVYDPQLEVYQPIERPQELRAMEWCLTGNDGEAWRQGAGAREWSHYPKSVQGMSLIGERSWFVRPEWEWPREERYRGVVAKSVDAADEGTVKSAFDLTYKMYLEGQGQRDEQFIVLNDERQLDGPAYRWAAINSSLARALGWRPSTGVPFRWLDAAGNVMVESTYWRDGWKWIKPPRFESLGEGWFVSASAAAMDAILRLAPEAEIHLWVKRESHGDRPCDCKWHLRRPLQMPTVS